MSSHDRWLAAWSSSDAHVWCSEKTCANHADGVDVTHLSEYGQGWYEPEECWICHSEWQDEAPDDEEEDEDDE